MTEDNAPGLSRGFSTVSKASSSAGKRPLPTIPSGGKVMKRMSVSSINSGDGNLNKFVIQPGTPTHRCCVSGCIMNRSIKNYCVDHAKEFKLVPSGSVTTGSLSNVSIAPSEGDLVWNFLASIGMDKYHAQFVAEGFDRMGALMKVDEDDLMDMRIPADDLLIILSGIESL
jgi:hypothetical protein